LKTSSTTKPCSAIRDICRKLPTSQPHEALDGSDGVLSCTVLAFLN
jgi:hypothetical protein